MSEGPISGRLRSARRGIQRKKARKGLRKQRRQERRRERTRPYREELQSITQELSLIADELTGGPRSDAEGKQESLGATIANALNLPAQREDFDGDGDDDLAVFFGVDQDPQAEFNSPFAVFDQLEGRRESSDSTQDQEPFDPFSAIEEFEDNLPP
jgi:hypothetical protein